MDTPYTALARRYRPSTFSEVVGQERIAQTLRNAIHEGRVAHAYLFTGARGVGKTSMARIFAKALNCPSAVDGVPCNDCEICRGIAAGQDVDVSEIDGASNRGIDDIRTLRANVHVRSMRSKYKVYIVDEVHMLTKEAFNALLKTLEEPPPGVKFIFCTTEPIKVPDTILSRCQRFDFGTIATESIARRLEELAAAEGFEVDADALELVARRAQGSMRDSQSLFDQLLAFGTQHITAADVHRLLGTAPDDRLIELVQALLDRRRDEALLRFHQALQDGVQLEPFFDQLLGYLRDLMIAATGAVNVPLGSVGPDQRPRLREQAAAWGLQTIVAGLEILAETKLRMQRTTFGRALAELALVRLSLLKDLDRLDDLIAQMKAGLPMGTVTAAVTSSPPRALPSATVSGPAVSAVVGLPGGAGASAAAARGSESRPPERGADIAQKKTAESTVELNESPEGMSANTGAVPFPVVSRGGLASGSKAVPRGGAAPAKDRPSGPWDGETLSNDEPEGADERGGRGASAGGGTVGEAIESGVPMLADKPMLSDNQSSVGVNGVSAGKSVPLVPFTPESAPELLARLQAQFVDIIGTSLRQVASTAISGPNQLEFFFPPRYDLGRRACQRPEVQSRIEAALETLTGQTVRVRFSLGAETGPVSKPVPAPAAGPIQRPAVDEPTDPLVAEVARVFGVKTWRVQELGPVPVAVDEESEPPAE